MGPTPPVSPVSPLVTEHQRKRHVPPPHVAGLPHTIYRTFGFQVQGTPVRSEVPGIFPYIPRIGGG